MAFISLDSPSCEVPCWILRLVVYRDVTRQAKELYRLKHEVALKEDSRTWAGVIQIGSATAGIRANKCTLEIYLALKVIYSIKFD
jgi:hypothetical protein